MGAVASTFEGKVFEDVTIFRAVIIVPHLPVPTHTRKRANER